MASNPPRPRQETGGTTEDPVKGVEPEEKKEDEEYRDKWGFPITPAQRTAQLNAARTKKSTKLLARDKAREQKWLEMRKDWSRVKPQKLKSRCRKGIPEALRGEVWLMLSGGEELMKANPGKFQALCDEDPESSIAGVIDRDLDRTFPKHEIFKKENKEGQQMLKNVLRAYAVYDREVGYCQGMGFVATIFLLYMREEEAFWTLVAVLRDDGPYAIRGTYATGLPLLKQRYFQLAYLVRQFMPKLARKFKELDVIPELYSSKWFMTLFAYDFPFDATVRIFDLYLSEGNKILFRIALQCLKNDEEHFLSLGEDMLFSESQKIHTRITMPDLIDDCLKLKLTSRHLESAKEAYVRHLRLEKEKAEKKKKEKEQKGAYKSPDYGPAK